jgi:hypothetical protein
MTGFAADWHREQDQRTIIHTAGVRVGVPSAANRALDMESTAVR